METINQIKEFAKKNGYNEVELYARKKGYEVYEAYNMEKGRPPCVGYPSFVLVFDKSIRMATEEETQEIIGV